MSKQIRNKLAIAVLATAIISTGVLGATTDTSITETTGIVATDINTDTIEAAVTYDSEDTYTDWKNEAYTAIKLSNNNTTVDGDGVTVEGNTITITAAGTYVLSGTLEDGNIIVAADKTAVVRIVLNGVTLHASETAPIFISKAKKAIISLAAGTTNTITDEVNYVFPDADTDEPDAAIFSKTDLVINGTGKLVVDANYGDAIASKDSLKILDGVINIDAADDGIRGKDMLLIKDGTITINSEGDALKSTNDSDTALGFISIEGGTLNLTASSDGIQAETAAIISGGTINIVTGGGSAKLANKTSSDFRGAATTTTEEDTVSTKGIKASAIKISGGTFNIDTLDDSIHSNGNALISGGSFKIASGDDGIHADVDLTIDGGDILITTSYEGLEGQNITLNDGNIHLTATDDGVNAAGNGLEDTTTEEAATQTSIQTPPAMPEGEINIDFSGQIPPKMPEGEINTGFSGQIPPEMPSGEQMQKGQMPADMFEPIGEAGVVGGQRPDRGKMGGAQGGQSSGNNALTINGGYLYINAGGDGLDCNGSITMTGGTVLVDGPTNGGNGALDYDNEFNISGGTLIAAGSSGMAQNVSSTSEQGTIKMTFTSVQEAGTLFDLQDSTGNIIASFAPSKNYQTVVISSPEITTGGTYSIYSGGTVSGTNVDGLYTDGTHSGGTKVVEFTTSDVTTSVNESGITTNDQGGMQGGGRQNMNADGQNWKKGTTEEKTVSTK